MTRPLGLGLALLFVASSALAEPAKEFSAGERAFASGDFRRAADAFEAAYRQRPHHAPLWNAARSAHRAGQWVRAANLLERYLHEAPIDAPDRERATAALAEVRDHVGVVELHRANARDVKLDEQAIDAALVYVSPGEHLLTAVASDGTSITRRLVLGSGASASVSLAPVTVVPPPAPSREPTIEKRGPSPFIVIGAGAATLASGTLATAFGLDTIDKRDGFKTDPTPERFADAHASQTRTNVALVTTGVFALATAALAIGIHALGWGTAAPRTTAGLR